MKLFIKKNTEKNADNKEEIDIFFVILHVNIH